MIESCFLLQLKNTAVMYTAIVGDLFAACSTEEDRGCLYHGSQCLTRVFSTESHCGCQ